MEKSQLKESLSELAANAEKRREDALAAAAQRVAREGRQQASPHVEAVANCGD